MLSCLLFVVIILFLFISLSNKERDILHRNVVGHIFVVLDVGDKHTAGVGATRVGDLNVGTIEVYGDNPAVALASALVGDDNVESLARAIGKG